MCVYCKNGTVHVGIALLFLSKRSASKVLMWEVLFCLFFKYRISRFSMSFVAQEENKCIQIYSPFELIYMCNVTETKCFIVVLVYFQL